MFDGYESACTTSVVTAFEICWWQVYRVTSWLYSGVTLATPSSHSVFSYLFKVCRMAQIPLGSTRLDSTHSTCRAHAFGCVELVEEHSSTRSTRRARLARHDELGWLDWLDTSSSTGATCNLVMITVIHLLISYLLIN